MTSNSISAELRKLVIQRASGCCEYCRIHQYFSIYTHEVDHIIAVKHGDDNYISSSLSHEDISSQLQAYDNWQWTNGI